MWKGVDKRNLEGKSCFHWYGSFVLYEMSIAQELTFNSQKLKFDENVDFREGVQIQKHESQLADVALDYIFRPYLASWIQPIAVFSAKGSFSRRTTPWVSNISDRFTEKSWSNYKFTRLWWGVIEQITDEAVWCFW